MLTGACVSGSKSAEGQQLRDLQAQVVEIQRANVALQKRVEELNHGMFLLQDRVDSNQVSLSRQRPRPELKVVKLTPEASSATASPAAAAPAPATEPEPHPDDAEPIMLTNAGAVRGAPAVAASARPAASSRAKRPRAARASNPGAVAAYREALDLLEGGKVNQALLKFARFVEQYPRHELTDNALYWSGEAYFDQQEYGLAFAEFQRVINEHPQGNKVPDALLKTALCLAELNGETKAKNVLFQLVDLYPSSEAAQVAQEKLAQLK